ncbi:MAG: acylphosphatase [Candidatus Aminicenantes bacterium]|nr:acylphosphatase [Candidatus Aminicenantes bacterium]
MSGEQRARVLVSGIVQGVFFRDHTRRWAGELGLRGWVRNLRDGRVELTVEGSEESIQALLASLRKGPPRGRVDGLEVSREPFRGEFSDFRILPDG